MDQSETVPSSCLLIDNQFRLLQVSHSKEILMLFKKILKDTKAATAIEYGLIAALIAVAGITAMTNVGKGVSKTFNNVSAKL